MKIRTKLFLANLLIAFILLGSLTYILIKRSSEIVFENIVDNASLSLSQVTLNIDHKLSSYENIANALYLDNSMQEKLSRTYSDLRDAYEVYFENVLPFFTTVQNTSAAESRLRLFTNNPTFSFADIKLIDESIKKSEWYQTVMKSAFGGYWTDLYSPEMETNEVTSFRRRLNNLTHDSQLIASVEVDITVFYDLINEESKGKRYIFALGDGSVLVDSIKENKIASLQQLPYYEKIEQAMQGSFPYKDGKQSYQILYQTLNSRSSVKGMKVISIIPVTALMPKIDQLRSLSLVLFAVACLVSGIFMLAFSVGVTRRYTELGLMMKRIHKDNFQSFIEVKGKDEVAQLGQIFNVMVQRLGRLVNDVYLSEIDRKEQALRTKEVELYALQTQINPHFLFNILNMIRGKLLIAGDRDNANIVGLLAKSFRMMLKTGGSSIQLAEEVEFVDIYLRLQSYRYVDKFQYLIEIPSELEQIKIPKLCLQPLVENAITHGIELKKTKSQIVIRGERIHEEIHIIVEDDGLGISRERLAEIQGWLQDEGAITKDTHIGLKNVHHRLKHLYGDAFGLVVVSEIGQGTRVTMIIPYQSIREGDDLV